MDNNATLIPQNGTQSQQKSVDLTLGENLTRFIGFYIGLSLLSLIGCLLIAVTIARNDDMRKNRFYVIIQHMCVCRAITSCQYIVAGVYHALRVTGLASPYQTHFTCAMFHIWLAGGLFLEMLDLAFLVIDRIISIAFPMRYWNMKAKQAIIVCISLYFVANGIKTVPILAFNDLNAPTVCVNSFSSLTENLAYFAQLADNVILGLVIGLQALLMGFVYYRSKRAASTEAERRSIERQLALLPILRRQIILHCGMQIVSKTLLSANLFVADQYVSVRLAACGSMMVTFDIFVNTSVILLNKDMRKACLQAIKRTSNQVSSMVHVRVTSTV